MKKFLLPETGTFYKANLHCHTTCSDGATTPEETKRLYMEQGYSIIAFTDHERMVCHNDLTDDKFLALNGFEYSCVPIYPNDYEFGYYKCCHICMIAEKASMTPDMQVESGLRNYRPEIINASIAEAKKRGFYVVYNHPVWSDESYPEYMAYNGYDAMEMVNYGCVADGYEERNMHIYDDMLKGGKKIGCVATDDNHNPPRDAFGGYTMIKSDSLNYDSIISALYAKNYYCSEGGPAIKELYIEGDYVHIEFENARECFVTTAARMWIDGRRAYDPEGKLTHHSFLMNPKDTYFRFTVVGMDGKCSWTNAYFYSDLLFLSEKK